MSKTFIASFGYSNITVACEDATSIVKDLEWQMDSLLTLPSCTQTEWFQTLQMLEPSNSTFRVLGAMYLIWLVFENPFPIFDRLGCQKCVATREFVSEGMQSLSITHSHADGRQDRRSPWTT
jgi:hypothetical protein